MVCVWVVGLALGVGLMPDLRAGPGECGGVGQGTNIGVGVSI